jgi:hypothetical protein
MISYFNIFISSAHNIFSLKSSPLTTYCQVIINHWLSISVNLVGYLKYKLKTNTKFKWCNDFFLENSLTKLGTYLVL